MSVRWLCQVLGPVLVGMKLRSSILRCLSTLSLVSSGHLSNSVCLEAYLAFAFLRRDHFTQLRLQILNLLTWQSSPSKTLKKSDRVEGYHSPHSWFLRDFHEFYPGLCQSKGAGCFSSSPLPIKHDYFGMVKGVPHGCKPFRNLPRVRKTRIKETCVFDHEGPQPIAFLTHTKKSYLNLSWATAILNRSHSPTASWLQVESNALSPVP